MRSYLKLLFTLILTSCFCSLGSEAGTKILLIGKQPDHKWGTHMYLHTQAMLAKTLRLTEGIETEVVDVWPKDPKALEGVKTIVIYSNPAAELMLQGAHAKAFEQMMNDGVGLVTMHWASSVHKKNLDALGPRWMSYLGGTWVSNVGITHATSPLKQLIPDHPICRGWEEYELHDEFYLNPTLGKGKALLQVENKGAEVMVGWVYERPDGGRAFGTTLGHYYRNFQQENFRRMIINGVLWSAGVDIPEGGAKVSVGEEALALPDRK